MTLITRQTYNTILEGEAEKRRAEAPPRGLGDIENQEIIIEGKAAERNLAAMKAKIRKIKWHKEEAFYKITETEAKKNGDIPGWYTDIADVLVEDLEDLFVAGVNKLPKVKRRARVKQQCRTWNRLFAYLCAAWTAGCRIGTMYLVRSKTGQLVLQIPLRWHLSKEHFKDLTTFLNASEEDAAPEIVAFKAAAENYSETDLA